MNPGNVACILTLHFTEIDKNFFFRYLKEREKKVERIISLVENGMSSKKPNEGREERMSRCKVCYTQTKYQI